MSWHPSYIGLCREGQVPDDPQNRAENCHNFKFLSDSSENIILWQFWFPQHPCRDIHLMHSVIILTGDNATRVIQIVSLKCRRVVKIKETLKPSRSLHTCICFLAIKAVFLTFKTFRFQYLEMLRRESEIVSAQSSYLCSHAPPCLMWCWGNYRLCSLQ